MPYRTELKRPDLKGQFPCSVCGKVFCHSSSLSRHRMQAHFKSYTCSQCNQEITSNETLRSHMFKFHHISRMFMCRCCNWAFPDKTSLHMHMQSMSRTGRPGDVAVLARSSIEGDAGDIDVTHSPSTSPHDDDTIGHAAPSSISPTTILDDLCNAATSEHSSMANKHSSFQLLQNSVPTDLLSTLSALMGTSSLGGSPLAPKLNSILNNGVSPSSNNNSKINAATKCAQPDISAHNSQFSQMEFLKKLKANEKISKDLLTALNSNVASGNSTSGIFSNFGNNGYRSLTANNGLSSNSTQQLLLGFLKNNPFITATSENDGTNSKILSAALAAAARANTTTTAATQHLPHTQTANSTIMSDISRLLSMSTNSNNAAPPAKRSRVSNVSQQHADSLTNADFSGMTSNTLSTLKALQNNRAHVKSESSAVEEFCNTLNNDDSNSFNLSISTSATGMHGSDAFGANASHLSAGGESSSACALSSSASSPRADTPSGKLLNSVIDKMRSSKSEYGNADNDGRASSAQELCITPTNERRNKRKARVPKQFTDIKPNISDGKTLLPAAKTSSMLEHFTRATQKTEAKSSEQLSPAVSDSQTSGSSTTTQQIVEMSGTNTTSATSSKIYCTGCQEVKGESDQLKSRIAKLETQLKTRLGNISAVVTDAVCAVNVDASGDMSKLMFLQYMKKISAFTDVDHSNLEKTSEHEMLASENIFENMSSVGFDMEGDDDNESSIENKHPSDFDEIKCNKMNESTMYEGDEGEDTIEINCQPSPGDDDDHSTTPSPCPDVSTSVGQ